MIFNIITKITGIEKDTRYPGAAGAVKYAADVLLYIAVCFYLVVIGVCLPLYLPGYEKLGTDKGQFWIKWTGISGKLLLVPLALYVLFFIIRLLSDNSSKKSLSALFPGKPQVYSSDIWAAAFCVSVIISRALSEEKEIALYGERGWYLGMFSYAALGIGVIVIPRLGKAKNPFPAVIMAASFVVSLIGIIMDYAGNVFNFAGWSPDRVSTLGNANWFGGYLITVMFTGTACFFLRDKDKLRKGKFFTAWLIIYMAVTFYMIIGQGSATAHLAMIAVMLALMIFAGKNPEGLLRVSVILLVFSVSMLIHALYISNGGYSRVNDPLGLLFEKTAFALGFVFTCMILTAIIRLLIGKGKTTININIGTLLTAFTVFAALIYLLLLIANTCSLVAYLGKEGSIFWFDNSWGSSRGATLKAGWEIFKGMTPFEKLFGKGPDNFYSFLMSERFPETSSMILEYFGGARLTNSHCEPLTMLVNTGFAGTISYYGLMICIMVRGFKKASGSSGKGVVIPLACSLCILAYIINNIFSFQTAANVSQLALVLGFGAWAALPGKSEDR